MRGRVVADIQLAVARLRTRYSLAAFGLTSPVDDAPEMVITTDVTLDGALLHCRQLWTQYSQGPPPPARGATLQPESPAIPGGWIRHCDPSWSGRTRSCKNMLAGHGDPSEAGAGLAFVSGGSLREANRPEGHSLGWRSRSCALSEPSRPVATEQWEGQVVGEHEFNFAIGTVPPAPANCSTIAARPIRRAARARAPD